MKKIDKKAKELFNKKLKKGITLFSTLKKKINK